MEAVVSEDPYTISRFMDLLIASLVLKGVEQINIIGEGHESGLDRRGLHAMYATAEQAVELYMRKMGDVDGNMWFHFLVRTRNELAPGHQGSFPGFRRELVQKTVTLVNLEHGAYAFGVCKPHAESILEGGHPNIRLYADSLATAFVHGRQKVPA